jgi:serine/threonine protein kinase
MAKKKSTGKFYAIKILQKKKIMQDKKQYTVFRERQALVTLDHPNIVKMYWTFDVRTACINSICNNLIYF